jgi:hypothetical protein
MKFHGIGVPPTVGGQMPAGVHPAPDFGGTDTTQAKPAPAISNAAIVAFTLIIRLHSAGRV